MRNRCRHLRQTHRPQESREIVVCGEHSVLRTMLLLHIDMDAIPPKDFSACRTLRNASHQEPAVGPIRTADSHLNLEASAGVACRVPTVAKKRCVFRMEDAKECLPMELVRRLSKMFEQVAVAVFDAPLRICRPDLLRNRFGKQPQLSLALRDLEV